MPTTALVCMDGDRVNWSKAIDERKHNVLYDKLHSTWGKCGARESAGILESTPVSLYSFFTCKLAVEADGRMITSCF